MSRLNQDYSSSLARIIHGPTPTRSAREGKYVALPRLRFGLVSDHDESGLGAGREEQIAVGGRDEIVRLQTEALRQLAHLPRALGLSGGRS